MALMWFIQNRQKLSPAHPPCMQSSGPWWEGCPPKTTKPPAVVAKGICDQIMK